MIAMFEKVRDMLAKQLNLKPEQITPQSDVVKDLGADSLDVVELLISLEDDYGISIPEDDIVNVKTVQDIVDMIEKTRKVIKRALRKRRRARSLGCNGMKCFRNEFGIVPGLILFILRQRLHLARDSAIIKASPACSGKGGNMKDLVLIDGNSLLNRAFYGMRPLNLRDGTPTNAVLRVRQTFVEDHRGYPAGRADRRL